ncbi:MAG: ATP-dependent DNA helicase DinG [Alphaproteobacteria bacterium]|nr:ATP-dependent DNA helicase DinG [Alphaproteobacteria bacterium]
MNSGSDASTGVLDQDLMSEIKTGLAAMGNVIPGFSPRIQQREMIAEVSRVLSGSVPEKTGVIEAGTGSGKSLGYSIPAIPIARRRGLKLVIAVSTISLQEQLLARDLPNVATGTGWRFTAAIAKGRDRYACPLKLARVARTTEVTDYAELLERLRSGHWNGDRDALDAHACPEWRLASASRHECLGGSCPMKASCPLMIARQAARNADIVITNQDLLVSDLRAGGGALLPHPRDSLLVVDEAHSLPEKAKKAGGGFGVELTSERLSSLRRVIFRTLLSWHWTAGWGDALLVRRMSRSLNTLSSTLRSCEWEGENGWRWRFPQGRVPESILSPVRRTLDDARALSAKLQERRERLLSEVQDGRIKADAAQLLAETLGETARLAEQTAGALVLFAAEDSKSEPPAARWIDRREQPGGNRHKLCAAPCASAGFLREELWTNTAGTVLTSATITALGTFERYLEQSGLQGRARTMRLSYVFDYAAQGTLSIPDMDHSPDQDGHTDEVAYRLRSHLRPGEGTLALFTSRKAMEQVAATLADLGDGLLVQDWLSKSEILRRHAETIAAGRSSLILGLQSFSEGVDLPGNLCTTVVLARLPFSVPTHPVDVTYAEWLRSKGRDPFREVAMPSAAIRCLQSVGRVIRKESDHGEVVIMDSRAKTKRYGRELMDSLPPFRRVGSA